MRDEGLGILTGGQSILESSQDRIECRLTDSTLKEGQWHMVQMKSPQSDPGSRDTTQQRNNLAMYWIHRTK
jgi:hypothetical protein